MKIVIKVTHIAEGGGLTHINKMIEWFGKLAPQIEFLLVGKSGQEGMFIPPPNNFTYKFHRFPSLNIVTRLLWDRFIFHKILKKSGSDLLFEPGNTGTMNSPCPKVSLIHNIAPFDEENFANESFYQKLRNRVLRVETIKSIKSTDGVILLSEYCEEFFSEYINRDTTKTAVIYHGKPEFVDNSNNNTLLEKLGISGEYILTVSHVYRYKKLKELIQAYLVSFEQNRDLPKLYIAGTIYDKKYFRDIQEVVNQTRHPKMVIFLGQVDPEPLQALYQNCKVFLFSSVLETCSVILIEALANGCAMACSNRSVVPEICGDAAIYFDPHCLEDIAQKILRLCEDESLNASLREKAKSRAKNFSWEKAAAETLSFLEEVLNDNIQKRHEIQDWTTPSLGTEQLKRLELTKEN